MTKKKGTTVSKGADGKSWVMPEAKPSVIKRGKKAAINTPSEKKIGKRTPVLASLDVAPKKLVVTYKGAPYSATVNPDGTITVNGKTFTSPSRAGKEVTGKEVDGWTFWSYEVPGEGLKKLNTLRK